MSVFTHCRKLEKKTFNLVTTSRILKKFGRVKAFVQNKISKITKELSPKTSWISVANCRLSHLVASYRLWPVATCGKLSLFERAILHVVSETYCKEKTATIPSSGATLRIFSKNLTKEIRITWVRLELIKFLNNETIYDVTSWYLSHRQNSLLFTYQPGERCLRGRNGPILLSSILCSTWKTTSRKLKLALLWYNFIS